MTGVGRERRGGVHQVNDRLQHEAAGRQGHVDPPELDYSGSCVRRTTRMTGVNCSAIIG